MGVIDALVCGPRTVIHAEPCCRVTHISQWLAATEMKVSSGALRDHHSSSTKGELESRRSIANSSVARFITSWTSRCGKNSSADPDAVRS
jgi:hypothetical protein